MDSRVSVSAIRKVVVTALVGAGWLIVVVLAVAALLRLVARDRGALLFELDAYTFWVFLPAYAALVIALVGRRPLLGAAALVLVVCHVVWVLPSFARAVPIPDAARRAPHLVLVSANLRYNNREPAALAGELGEIDADVLDLQEVTPAWIAELRRSGLLARYPHQVLDDIEGPGGTAILSRLPITEPRTLVIDGDRMASATIEVAGRRVRLLAVHPSAPVTFSQYEQQRAAVADYARHAARPLILAGDFNTTQYNGWFGRLGDLGLRSAHVMLGQGLATTWPNGMRRLPPIRIDHVFVSAGVVPLTIREGTGAGSDHKPVIVRLALMRQ